VGDTEIWKAANGTLDPPGAEPIAGLEARVKDGLISLGHLHAGRRSVAVVTHGGAIRTVLRLLADGHLPLASAHPAILVEPILNASILHLAVGLVDGEPVWRVVAINDVEHLADEARSARDAG
jgi:broad specificity phosphatase PhoE